MSTFWFAVLVALVATMVMAGTLWPTVARIVALVKWVINTVKGMLAVTAGKAKKAKK